MLMKRGDGARCRQEKRTEVLGRGVAEQMLRLSVDCCVPAAEVVSELKKRAGTAHLINPRDSQYLNVAIPDRYRLMVVSHCLSTLAENLAPDGCKGAPVFLMVCGEPGSGKTFQAIASCVAAGFAVYYCSGASLTGSDLGMSAEMLTEVHRGASAALGAGACPVIVIDDLHMSEASVGDGMVTTINSSLLTGRLMNLCDDPSLKKIPIIVTANSYRDIDPALMRAGRSRCFIWKPTDKEKRMVVERILCDVVGRSECSELFERYSGRTIGFFSALKDEALRLCVESDLQQIGPSGLPQSLGSLMGNALLRSQTGAYVDADVFYCAADNLATMDEGGYFA